MNQRAVLAFLAATVLSATAWVLSPTITGRAEPWDAEGPYYLIALAVAGAAAGGLVPRPLWAHYLGAVFGQAGYELLFFKIGPLFVLGVLFLLGYSAVFFAAAAIGASIRLRRSNTKD